MPPSNPLYSFRTLEYLHQNSEQRLGDQIVFDRERLDIFLDAINFQDCRNDEKYH